MKIGVLGMFYGNADLLPKVLEPWLELKREGVPIVFGALHAQFKEYAELGLPNDDAETLAVLGAHTASFDIGHSVAQPLSEKDARTFLLSDLLLRDVDLVWLLDGDELYTKEQIQNIICYIKETPQFDYYHVNFQNWILDSLRSTDMFAPPRIFRNSRHGGIKEFVWDNELVWKDGTKPEDTVPGIVPKRIAHVEHRTWRKNEMERKIAYHRKHFGFCPYTYDPTSGALGFDLSYYRSHEMPIPTIANGTIGAPKPPLHIIVRTHSVGNFRPGIARVTDALGGRAELTLRSLRSIVHAALVLERANIAEVRLTVLDDHSDEATVARMRKELELCPFAAEFVELASRGNGPSLRESYERARAGGAPLVYFVEDDYLHEPTSILEMALAYRQFARNTGRAEVGIHPVDYLDRYTEGILPSRVVLGSKRHWRTIESTTGTFMISRATLEGRWSSFILFSENGANETTSINPVWREHTLMFSPIPTLAYHMHLEEGMPPFSNWKKLWDSLAPREAEKAQSTPQHL